MSRITNPGRFAGVLYVVTLIFGFFAMGYVPGKLIVHGDTAATSSNISAHETLFRMGIASQLIGMAGFIFGKESREPGGCAREPNRRAPLRRW